jgi:hypothetical protein
MNAEAEGEEMKIVFNDLVEKFLLMGWYAIKIISRRAWSRTPWMASRNCLAQFVHRKYLARKGWLKKENSF